MGFSKIKVTVNDLWGHTSFIEKFASSQVKYPYKSLIRS